MSAQETRGKGTFSLQRRIQALVAVSLVIAMIVLVAGVGAVYLMANRDEARDAAGLAAAMIELIGQGREDELPAWLGRPQENLDEILSKNPGAWYYYEDETRVIRSSPDAPKFKSGLVGHAFELTIESEITEGDPTVQCPNNPSVFGFETSDGHGAVYAGGCGSDAFYIEVAGINKGFSAPAFLWRIAKVGFLGQLGAKGNIFSTFLIVLVTIGGITLLFGNLMRRVKEVSSAASSIGRGKHQVRLPEESLPSEVLPMVQAINRAIDRLERASEQQALFVAAAAHELRTPMTVFRTRLEQMDESELKDELVQDMRRVDTMVTQLLALAKLGVSELDLEKLDLVDVVRTTCRERGGAVFVAGKELAFESNGDTAHILGDRESVKTAVANLIDNALLFTPEGTTVQVSVDGSKVTVSDQGPGVDAEDKDRIFEPFYKTPPNKPGHGLGLAIVSEIMRIHEGSVSTHNAESGGAVFELTFKEAA